MVAGFDSAAGPIPGNRKHWSTLAAEVALVREPGADAGLQEAKSDASEECVAPEASAATVRAGAVAARKRKVGSRAEVPPAKAEAWLGALSTSPAAGPDLLLLIL